MLRYVLISLTALTLSATPGMAQTLFQDYDLHAHADGPAQVLGVSRQGRDRIDAAGRLAPGGRATRGDDIFAVASIGKTMTAVAVLQLAARGEIALEDAAVDHLPGGFTLPANLTIRHLLAMSSGLADYYDDDFLAAAAEDPAGYRTLHAAIEYGLEEPALFAPGRRFDYSNTNYLLLQAILEHRSGRSMDAYFRQYIFAPAGMRDARVFGAHPLPPNFVQGAESGLSAREIRAHYSATSFGDGAVILPAADLFAFYRALFESEKLLPRDWVTLLITDQHGDDYGLGIEVTGNPGDQTVGHSGGDLGFSSNIRYHIPSGTAVLYFIARGETDTDITQDILDELVD